MISDTFTKRYILFLLTIVKFLLNDDFLNPYLSRLYFGSESLSFSFALDDLSSVDYLIVT
jgi:hypothetical protein